MFIQIQFDPKKSGRAIQAEARKAVFDAILPKIAEVFGAEFTTQTGTATVAVGVGEVPISDGTVAEVAAKISVSVPAFETHATAKKTIDGFDRDTEGADFAEKQAEREAAKVEAERKKAEKIARDKAARAKAKAEREAKKNANQ